MSPLIEYTNLLHHVQSLSHPKVVAFKVEHKNDPSFQCGVHAVEAAFQARQLDPVTDEPTGRAG